MLDSLNLGCESIRSLEAGIAVDSSELAHRLVVRAGERNASAITLLDLRGLTTIADYFVVCTATSTVQMRAVVDDLALKLARELRLHARAEGRPDDGWMVVDFRDVLVHVFLPEKRNYYRLEEFWSDAPALVQMA